MASEHQWVRNPPNYNQIMYDYVFWARILSVFVCMIQWITVTVRKCIFGTIILPVNGDFRLFLSTCQKMVHIPNTNTTENLCFTSVGYTQLDIVTKTFLISLVAAVMFTCKVIFHLTPNESNNHLMTFTYSPVCQVFQNFLLIFRLFCLLRTAIRTVH